MPKQRYDVCGAVIADLPFDGRVWKEARSLARGGYSVILVGPRYDLPKRARRNEDGIDVIEVPFGDRSGSASKLERVLALVRVWIDIVRTPARSYHAHNIHVGPPAWLAARLRGAKLVYDGHELYGYEARAGGFKSKLVAKFNSALERFLVRASAGVITTNRSRANVLEERHGREGVVVLANVPFLVRDVKAVDPGYPAGVPTLLYQGYVRAEERAFEETIKALPLVPEVHFTILGFSRQKDTDAILRWAREAGVEDRIHFYGPVAFDELVGTAVPATVGLVPIKAIGVNEHLGDTNKLHEYLMAGVPVVGSDLPEIRRVVTSGSPPVGEVFDPLSPESIAAAIRAVIDDPRYEERRREARRLAVEHHNWDVQEAQLLELYGRVLNGNGNGNGHRH